MVALTRKQKLFLLKVFSLFSVVRGYNIFVIVLAQYLGALFILAPVRNLKETLLDTSLFAIIFATAFTIAAGYIINNFYDSEKDLINRPRKSMLDRLISQQTKLTIYFILNFIAVIVVSYVSFQAVLFFAVYIFGIWLYSHKLKKKTFWGNLIAALLAIAPFFVVFVYYQNVQPVIFAHAAFLFLIIVIRELLKDLENIKGDLVQGYQTIPIKYGIKMSNVMLTILVGLSFVPASVLVTQFDIGYMHIYFHASMALLVFCVIAVWQSTAKAHYLLLHNMLKFLILAGVFSVLLIDKGLVLDKILNLFN